MSKIKVINLPEFSATNLSILQRMDKDERTRLFLWLPQAGPQTVATVIDVDELLYGGARGGGKTSLLLGRFLGQAVSFGIHARGVIFRRTYKQLDEIVHQAKQIFCRGPKKEHIARWNKSEYQFDFTNGANLRLRHLEALEDCDNFVGQSLSYMGFDEVGTFRDFQMYLTLLSCMRSTHSKMRPIVVSTANPGGRLHNEVKKYFHIGEYPHGGRVLRNKEGRTRVYIRSLLQDNEYLRGTSYEKVLRGIKDPLRRRAWLLGDWSVSLGSFFGDLFQHDVHVIKPTTLPPKHWIRFRSMDWGSAKPYAVLWWTISDGETRYTGKIFPKNTIIIYRELYGCDPEENDTGLRETVTEVAEKIRLAEVRDGDGMVQAGAADTAMWQSPDGGPSIGERFASCKVPFLKSFKQRKIGWEQVRIRLKGFDTPMLYISHKCVNLIRTLPILTRDEKAWDDVETSQEDHCIPMGYGVMTDKGAVPIEKIKPGDVVFTRFGWWPIIACGETARVHHLVRITLEDGRILEGTPGHRVLSRETGGQWAFTPLGLVSKSSQIQCLEPRGAGLWDRLGKRMGRWRAWSLAVRSTTEIQLLRSAFGISKLTREGIAREEHRFSTEMCGKPPMGQFLRGMSYTILTAMCATTISTICNFSRLSSITACTARRILRSLFGAKIPPMPSAGVVMQKSDSLKCAHTMESASSVGIRRPGTELRKEDSAVSLVPAPSTGKTKLTWRSGFVRCARRVFAAIRRVKLSHAPHAVVVPIGVVKVERLEFSEPIPVFNLTVERVHEYAVNGLITLNCADVLRYICMARQVAAPTEEQRLDRQKTEANQRKTLDRRYSG